MVVQPVGSVTGVAFPTQPQVRLQAADLSAVSLAGIAITAVITSGSGSLIGSLTATTNASGIATFIDVGLVGSGAHTLRFTANGLTDVVSASVSVADRLVVTVQPAGATTGQAFTTQPVVRLQSQDLSFILAPGLTVTATIASGTGVLSGAAIAITDVAGIASFATLVITGSGNHTLSFMVSGTSVLPTTSSTFSVSTAGVASKLAMSVQPGSMAITEVVLSPQPQVRLQDSLSANVLQAGVMVTASIASGPGSLSGTVAVATNAQGVAVFTDLIIAGVGSHTLNFTAIPAGLTAVVSGAISVSSGVATKLAMVIQPSPSGSTAGAAFATQPQVRLQDVASVNILQAGVVVTVAIDTGTGTLSGTATATTNASGVATFVGLALSPAGTFTLIFTSPGLTSVVSNAVVVSSGVATKLAMVVQPSGANPGVAFAIQPQVRLQDAASGNSLQAGVTITAAINSGSGTLSGTVTAVTNASGVATFATLSLTPAGTYTLIFTSPGLTSVVSASLAVQAPGSFATPTHGTRDFENGSITTAFVAAPMPSFTNGTGISNPPRAVSAGWGYSLINNPAEAESGTSYFAYDYSPTTAGAHDTTCDIFRNSSTGANADELYWLFSFKIVGTPPMTELKWNRFTTIGLPQGDNFGLYYSYNTFGFAWGRHDVGNENFLHAIGLNGGVQPVGLVNTYGYTKYGENICNDGAWHRFLCHVQQNPPGGGNPRFRLWFDGTPIRQNPTGGMRNALNSQVYSGAARWTAPLANDPDYGVNAPSWMNVNARFSTNKIFGCDICVAMNQNAGNNGVGRINYDNMAWSTTPLAP